LDVSEHILGILGELVFFGLSMQLVGDYWGFQVSGEVTEPRRERTYTGWLILISGILLLGWADKRQVFIILVALGLIVNINMSY
jgi:hypothetical protein